MDRSELCTLKEAHSFLGGISEKSIRTNNDIRRIHIKNKVMYLKEDLEKYKKELELRKSIRINHISYQKKRVDVDTEKYSTAYQLSKILYWNSVTIDSILKKENLKFESWNNARFYLKKDALEVLNKYVLQKKRSSKRSN